MVVLRPSAPPPNPAAIHELKSRSMSLFRLWLREGLPPLPAFLLKHQVLLQAPISLAPEPGRPLPPPPPSMAASSECASSCVTATAIERRPARADALVRRCASKSVPSRSSRSAGGGGCRPDAL